jgi:hypothetical protein
VRPILTVGAAAMPTGDIWRFIAMKMWRGCRRMEAAEVLLSTRIGELSRELAEAKAAALRPQEVRAPSPPATRSEPFTPFQPSIDFP